MFRNIAESWKLFVPAVLLICCLSLASRAEAPMPAPGVTFSHLTCEYLVNPEGIDTIAPRLSWEEKSPAKSYLQSSYRIIVASSSALLRAGKGDLWDSGKVNSPRTLLCSYGGTPLKSRRRCWWAVRAWDTRGQLSAWSQPATFSMGLLSPQDWKASWIGKDARRPKPYLSALSGARWIWFPDAGQPSIAAQVGKRYFRSVVNVPGHSPVKRASFVGRGDNQFTFYVNGKQAGGSTSWYQVQSLDVSRYIHSGHNLIAIKAQNNDENGPNPAGLIGNQWLLQVLTDCGRADVAWSLVTQTARPSWGCMTSRGADTIWECWDL